MKASNRPARPFAKLTILNFPGLTLGQERAESFLEDQPSFSLAEGDGICFIFAGIFIQTGGRHRAMSYPLLKFLLIHNSHINFWVAHAPPHTHTVYLFSFLKDLFYFYLWVYVCFCMCLYTYVSMHIYIIYTYMFIHTAFNEAPLLPH